MYLILFTLLGGILDRLRGFDAGDVYKARGQAVPSLAEYAGYATSRGITSTLTAALFTLILKAHAEAPDAFLLYGFFFTTLAGLWIGGASGRSRTYSAYTGHYDDDDDLTRIVGRLIKGTSSFVNRVRGMVEASFYGLFVATGSFMFLLFFGGHGDALVNFPAYLVTRGLASGAVGFIPQTIKFPDIDWQTGKPFIDNAAPMRHAIAEFVQGCVLAFWVSYTIIY